MPMRSPLGRELRTLLTRTPRWRSSTAFAARLCRMVSSQARSLNAPRSEFAQTRDELGAGERLAGHHQERVVAGDRADDVVQGGPVQRAPEVVRPTGRCSQYRQV